MGQPGCTVQGTKSEEDEQLLIKDTTDTIKKHEGKAPSGWLGSGLSESYVGPKVLAAALLSASDAHLGTSWKLTWMLDSSGLLMGRSLRIC